MISKHLKAIHHITISLFLSFILCFLIDIYLIKIAFWQFVIIETSLGISEIFSTFVKKKLGLIETKNPQK